MKIVYMYIEKHHSVVVKNEIIKFADIGIGETRKDDFKWDNQVSERKALPVPSY